MRKHLSNPVDIETRSFEIISEELGYLPEERIRDIVFRVIHTTADFEYADLLEFKNDAVERAEELLEKGNKIYADTSMLKTGVNTKALEASGNVLVNYVHDEDVITNAKKNGTTRSIEGIRKAIDEGIKIYAIGNAPTALFELIEATERGEIEPELIIATPIGFVGASESKASLDEIEVPFIRVNGRKGGSAVAASILNSLLYRSWRQW